MVMPTAAVYCAAKHAVRAMTEGLRQEHDEVRSTLISPDASARAVRYAIAQPEGVDINEVIVRPTAADM
jgi:NADP-dependent 3-hydroxy acid dehydrogenase YdfG